MEDASFIRFTRQSGRMFATRSGLRQIFFYCILCCFFLGLILLNRFLYGYEYHARPSLLWLQSIYGGPAEGGNSSSRDDAMPRSIELIMEKIQLDRRNLIDESCRKIQWRRQSRPARFYVDDNHKLMYCYVPKVASTNLKRLMLILSGMVNAKNLSSIPRNFVHEDNQMRKFEPYNVADVIKHGMGNYTKMIFVRHPFERLVSAYKDKFADGNSSAFYQLAIGTEIVRKFRAQPSEYSLKNGHDVTFPEFVSYVIDQWSAGRRQLDVHWRPMIDLCLPCSMDYDIVGKFETLHRDVEFVLHKLKESEIGKLFRPNRANSTSFLKETMSQLNQKQISDLFRIYEDDFRIFGYQYTQ